MIADRAQQLSTATMKIALIAVFTAVSLGTNYAMIGLPNVKLMDAIVFIAAFLFGLEVGLGSAVSIWTVYGFVNPWGQDSLPLLLFLMVGECFYAVAGALLSRMATAHRLLVTGHSRPKLSLLFGLVGFQTTFAYDILTNFGSWVFQTSSLYQALIIGLITGAPFAVLHELSNLVFFATVVPLAIIASQRTGLTRQKTIQ
ncbi:MAG TPA: hypothetical protein VFE98_04190 [Candidatus Bathyarchaeia archaeon]|nr:hypothetical protein [Candidatus Bathyarchaeia archaeon]